MKINIKLLPKNALALISSSSIFLLLDYLVYTNYTIPILLCFIVLALQFYSVVTYQSMYTSEIVHLDLRSDEQKQIEKINKQYDLLNGAKNNFLMQVAQGTIDPKTAQSRIQDMLELIESNNNLLALPADEDELV